MQAVPGDAAPAPSALASARYDRRAFTQPGQRRGGRGHSAGHGLGCQHRREQVAQIVYTQLLERCVAVAARPRIPRHDAGLGRVGGQRAGQPETQPVLAAQHHVRPRQHLRLVLTQPAQQRQRTAGLHHRAGQAEHAAHKAGRCHLQPVQQGLRAPVVPQDRAAHRLPAGIDRPQPDHVGRDAHAVDLRAADASLGAYRPHSRADLRPDRLHIRFRLGRGG
jgi:hypothetical protein